RPTREFEVVTVANLPAEERRGRGPCHRSAVGELQDLAVLEVVHELVDDVAIETAQHQTLRTDVTQRRRDRRTNLAHHMSPRRPAARSVPVGKWPDRHLP